MRNKGGRLPVRSLEGPGCLVKGLEYGHALILDAKRLYIEIIRGSESLIIISSGRYFYGRYFICDLIGVLLCSTRHCQ